MTGETRVLIRGGPFEEMDLIYPRPKCKFGSNDRVVEATYVKCTQKPLSMNELEGKNKAKVSKQAVIILTHFFRPTGACNVTTVPPSANLWSSVS